MRRVKVIFLAVTVSSMTSDNGLFLVVGLFSISSYDVQLNSTTCSFGTAERIFN